MTAEYNPALFTSVGMDWKFGKNAFLSIFFVRLENFIRNLYEKMVIFSTFLVKKWNFVIKMYSFQKNMLYLETWTYQRGALICLRICKRKSAFKRNKHHETRNRKDGFGVFGVYSKKSLIPTRKLLSPSIRGWLPVYRARAHSRNLAFENKKAQPCGWAFYTLERVEKKVQQKLNLFYTLCCGWLVGIKKEPNFRWVLFIPFEKVEKKANLAVDFFIPPVCG